MSNWVNRYQNAKYSLMLVMLVIFVCSGQNMGWVTSCSVPSNGTQATDSYFNAPTLSSLFQQTESSETGATSEQCSLTDHLLQQHQHSIEHAIVTLLFIVLTFAMFAGVSRIVPVLTEPIPPTQRRHLTFCVFRE
ncbi:hypothetical protein C9I98_01050 [Photobacterium sanctipauli]|uniref:Copper resistance protein n=1 Tax=Photobacterium sanctipauli TaxID=1342794 RepID=A0A2T3P038_9GAMM|nr:hypothetical protein [Photobacterium sanctipauli]PSW21885.1 hypothetical protein C9I98_01050 [Photobacterium sanctipauli]